MCKGTDVVAEILKISPLMAFIFLIGGRDEEKLGYEYLFLRGEKNSYVEEFDGNDSDYLSFKITKCQ